MAQPVADKRESYLLTVRSNGPKNTHAEEGLADQGKKLSRGAKRESANSDLANKHSKSARIVFLKQQQADHNLMAKAVALEERRDALVSLERQIKYEEDTERKKALIARLLELDQKPLEVDCALPDLGALDADSNADVPTTPAGQRAGHSTPQSAVLALESSGDEKDEDGIDTGALNAIIKARAGQEEQKAANTERELVIREQEAAAKLAQAKAAEITASAQAALMKVMMEKFMGTT